MWLTWLVWVTWLFQIIYSLHCVGQGRLAYVVVLWTSTILVCVICYLYELLSMMSSLPSKKGKGVCIAIYGNQSRNYGVSLAVWDHTVLPSTRHKRTAEHTPPLPQPDRLVLDFSRLIVSGWRKTWCQLLRSPVGSVKCVACGNW